MDIYSLFEDPNLNIITLQELSKTLQISINAFIIKYYEIVNPSIENSIQVIISEFNKMRENLSYMNNRLFIKCLKKTTINSIIVQELINIHTYFQIRMESIAQSIMNIENKYNYENKITHMLSK